MIDMRRQELIQALPFARRYARALAGSQTQGDVLVASAVKHLLADTPTDISPRHSLYRLVTRSFEASNGTPEGGLSLNQRVLLLLTALEELPLSVAADILEIGLEVAEREIAQAHAGLRKVAQTSVLIIEDEPIIAMDIQDLVEQCGHHVAGVAHNEADAVALAEKHKPGLILADINLGHGEDGMHAVNRIMRTHKAPVIFVTAYPERLLTGATEEPPFVITKPFEPLTLAITTYQAVTGGMRAF